MIKEMLKAIIYTRVSTEEQTTNYSLDFQEETCKRYAQQNDLKVVKVFREEGVSAKTINGRPTLLKLIKYCQNKKNKISRVLVYKYDRWSRDTQQGLAIIALLAKHGVDVYSATEPFQNNAMGKAMRGMMLVWAQLDNDIKSERTKSGMKAAFEAGRWPWKAPIGYRHTVVNGKKKLILISKFKDMLRNLFLNASTGLYNKQELADKLNKDGYEQAWGSLANTKTIDSLLKKKFYFGIMVAKGWNQENEGFHTTVTDEETWLRAYKSVYGSKPIKRSKYQDMFPLKRLLLCDGCHRPLTASYSRGRGGKYSYYHCSRKDCSNPTRIATDNADQQFVDYLNQLNLSQIQRKLLKHKLLTKLEGQVKLSMKSK